MVCSTCGYENQVGNRFCGMCGTPLPHRPLTTPGAQSTASLERPLADNAGPIEPRAAAAPPARTGLAVEPRPHARDQQGISETTSNRIDVPSEPPLSSEPSNPSQDMAPSTQGSEAAPPQFDLVPEIPLHEYVQNFRYVPPSDPEEITMRGETTVLEPGVPAESNSASVAPVETAIAAAEAVPPTSADDVRERLGLEVDSTPEEQSDRPRFLDFNEPAASLKPAASAQPISGPSFLGLSDVPQVEAGTGDELDSEEPARGKWRIWLAAAVILVFGFLGVLEWRAQVRQTNNGPVEVIKMKMRNLTHRKPAESASTESAPRPATPVGSASKPEMQVEPPSNSQNQNPLASTATSTQTKDAASVPNTSAATTTLASSAPVAPVPAGNQPVAGQSSSTPLQNAAQTPAGQNAAATKTTTTAPPVDKSKLIGSQQPGSAAPPTSGKPKPSPQAADDNEEVVVRKIIPGAEEMAKAKNASDSAAEAAWLWKATAKGNPTAPVRLAEMYVKGEGVPRSCEQATVLLKTAAEKENAMARSRLALMYSTGICVQRNRVEAYRWLSSTLVANPNSEWAQQNRDLLWRQMTPEERTLAEKYR